MSMIKEWRALAGIGGFVAAMVAAGFEVRHVQQKLPLEDRHDFLLSCVIIAFGLIVFIFFSTLYFINYHKKKKDLEDRLASCTSQLEKIERDFSGRILHVDQQWLKHRDTVMDQIRNNVLASQKMGTVQAWGMVIKTIENVRTGRPDLSEVREAARLLEPRLDR